MPLINCKVELKLKWAKYCILSAASADNANANSSNKIIFTFKDTNVPIVTLPAKDNLKLSKRLSKELKISDYWNEFKTKSENKKTTIEYRYLLESKFV